MHLTWCPGPELLVKCMWLGTRYAMDKEGLACGLFVLPTILGADGWGVI